MAISCSIFLTVTLFLVIFSFHYEVFVILIDCILFSKKNKDERYRFKFVVEELRSGKDLEYLATVATFINCSIISAGSLKERIRIRNEYLGKSALLALYSYILLFNHKQKCSSALV